MSFIFETTIMTSTITYLKYFHFNPLSTSISSFSNLFPTHSAILLLENVLFWKCQTNPLHYQSLICTFEQKNENIFFIEYFSCWMAIEFSSVNYLLYHYMMNILNCFDTNINITSFKLRILSQLWRYWIAFLPNKTDYYMCDIIRQIVRATCYSFMFLLVAKEEKKLSNHIA